ncbi:STAS domain-containing protein [Actinokineospora soli]|uniref:STAS domain-containing protein n=1 Tax=Actinokineospora soli TaxID=1048753 RepID=A0ABW2TRD6_9PSEU
MTEPRPRLTGPADLRNRIDFSELLHALCRQAVGDVHLDLSEMDFVDAWSARALVEAAGSLAAGELVLHNPPAALRRLLGFLGEQPRLRLDP